MTGAELARAVNRRLTVAVIGANVGGAAIVFVLLGFVLPLPPDIAARNDALLYVNLGAALLFLTVSTAIGTVWSYRLWRPIRTWLCADRDPDDRERRVTLRSPLRQQRVNATMWTIATLCFTGLNAPFSGELGANTAMTVALGGVTTCALSYVLVERIMRPVAARALRAGLPARQLVPGITARILLAWALAAGVVLVGLIVLGAGALHEERFTAQRLGTSVLFLAILALVLGTVAMLATARSIADPVDSVRRALAQVQEGRLDVEVAVFDGSEVGLLQAGFNQMVHGLREREELRDLFGRQVGVEVARQALDRGAALGGEVREAAVLFVDVVGSTTLAATRPPEEVVAALNEFFAHVVAAIGPHGGWVNKFEGDAALCVFGTPGEHPCPAAGALGAARDLRAALDAAPHGLEAAIGVSAGAVVAGNVGAADRYEFTVIGDPVNEAARLTELAKQRPGRLLASAAAVERAGGEEARRWALGEAVTLRGRAEPTRLAEIVR